MNCQCARYESTVGMTRRTALQSFGMGLGSLALTQLWMRSSNASSGILGQLHMPAKAKRVIFLFQSGAPSQMDLFDYKPLLNKLHGTELPRFDSPRATIDRHVG